MNYMALIACSFVGYLLGMIAVRWHDRELRQEMKAGDEAAGRRIAESHEALAERVDNLSRRLHELEGRVEGRQA